MKPRGFTLIEMMIVVAIVGILLAVVVPLFNKGDENLEGAQPKKRQTQSCECVCR